MGEPEMLSMDVAHAIAESELVLIGIGEEMQVQLQQLKEISNFREKLSVLEKDETKEWLIPFLIRYYLDEKYHPDIIKAYQTLKKLLEHKNYFIISLSTDDLIWKAGLKSDRIVIPCGGYASLQCEGDCRGKLYQIDDVWWKQVCSWIEGGISLEALQEPTCPDCGSPLVVNQYGQLKYNESGYLGNWEKYTKWLQGTVNKKLCILELGVGMEFPSIIRWPFEKVCFYNQKASIWRVHSSLYQLSGELKGRGVSIKENPIIFLNMEVV